MAQSNGNNKRRTNKPQQSSQQPEFKERSVHISLDLAEAAVRQLEFLESVSMHPLLYDPTVAEHAVCRYEKYWLPLVKRESSGGRDLVAPLDIRWVMHCHMLSPLAYKEDTVQLTGRLIDSCLHAERVTARLTSQTRDLWERTYPGVSYELDLEWASRQPLDYRPLSKFDIRGSMGRQKDFYYQVSLPHYRDREFLKAAVLRYKKYLFLKQHNPGEFLVPCYDMDLVWHSHMLHPVLYEKDTTAVLGRVLNHDDSVNDRSEGSRLVQSDVRTRELWRTYFKEDFARQG